MPQGSSRDLLEASNSKLRLVVDPPARGRYHLAGENVSARASISDLSSFSEIEATLKVKSRINVMGKDRWQIAQMANAGLLAGSTGAAMVMQREDHLIYGSRQTLWPQSTASKSKKEGPSAHNVELSFDFELPEWQPTCKCGDHEQLRMPPSTTVHDTIMDMSGINVFWTLSIKGKRQGLLHRDQKVSLDLQVASMPSTLPTYGQAMLERSTSRIPLTFKSLGNDLQLQARIDLHDVHDGMVQSPCDVGFTLSWWLIARTGEPPHDSLLESLDIKMEAYLSRYPFTRPIDKPGNGQPFAWANQREVTGSINVPPFTSKSGERQASGSVSIPEHCVSFKSCGCSMDWRINARLSSKDHLAGSLMLHVPIVITHAPL